MPGHPNTNALAGTQWVLSTLNGNAPLEDTQVTLNFDTEGRVAGSDGCNRFFGSCSAQGDALAFQQIAGTLMACPPERMAQSRAFTRALGSTQTFAMADGNLTLRDAAGATLATFTALNTELAGTSWNVMSYNNGRQAVVSLFRDTSVTLAFNAEGRVAGNAGCNQFFGSFAKGAQGDGAITIGPLASTKKLCPAPEGVMEQEAQFLKTLESAATYRMDGDRLELRTKDDALAVSLRRAR
jgi:heat shock protein HslJ